MESVIAFSRQRAWKFCCLAALCIMACGNPSSIDTPREIVRDGDIRSSGNMDIPESAISFSTMLNNSPQQLVHVKNQFYCRFYRPAASAPYLAIRTELQNTDLSASPALNSLFFRSDSLPVDGLFHSLSGDPTDLVQGNASKLIFLSAGKYFDRIPFEKSSDQDNFQVRLSEINGRLNAEYKYSSRFDDGGGLKDFNVSGNFTIEP